MCCTPWCASSCALCSRSSSRICDNYWWVACLFTGLLFLCRLADQGLHSGLALGLLWLLDWRRNALYNIREYKGKWGLVELVQRIPLCIQFYAVYETYASSVDCGSHLQVRLVHDVTSGGSERIGEGHWWQSLLFSVPSWHTRPASPSSATVSFLSPWTSTSNDL